MTQRHEIEAWLGDEPGLTDEQIDQLAAVADEIGARYPDGDDDRERESAITVAYRLMVEDQGAVVGELADTLLRARQTEQEALAGIQQAAHTLVRVEDRSARGLESQAGFAYAAGVDRMAVRTWLGQ